MKLERLDIREDVNVEGSYFRIPLPAHSASDALVVKFCGVSGYGCNNNSDAVYMAAFIAAGLVAWEPMALILDLYELTYEWGDMMIQPLCSGYGHYAGGEDLPTAVVVSDLNRVGLTSLVEMEMTASPKDWLFESLSEALAAVDCSVSSKG